MRVVSGISLFCVIWTYSSHRPALLRESSPDRGSHPTFERPLLEPCEAPEPPKKVAREPTFLGVCRDE